MLLNFYSKLADPSGVAREKRKKKVDIETNVTFLCVPAELKVYYQYILVHKKGGGGVNAFVRNDE